VPDLNVELRVINVRELDERALALLGKYGMERDVDGAGRVVVPERLGDALAQLYGQIEVVSPPGSTPICDLCWETPSNDGYHSYQSLGTALDKLVAAFPNRVRKTSIGRSYEGRDVWALQVLAKSGVTRKRILLIGCHHAEEWVSVEVPLRIVYSVLDGTHGALPGAMDETEVWAVPMLNPDGHVFSVNYCREWRQSRAPGVDVERVLTFGVDLNRNYPVGFAMGGVSSPSPGTRDYHGPAPFSEPETSALRDLCLAKNFDGVLSFHAHARQILYPWGYRMPGNSGGEIAPLKALAEAMVEAITKAGGGYVAMQASRHYNEIVGGDFCDWAFQTFGKPALTVELGPTDWSMRLPSSEIAASHAEFSSGFATFVALL
jgi:carboxypeptidase T